VTENDRLLVNSKLIVAQLVMIFLVFMEFVIATHPEPVQSRSYDHTIFL
jgi:hypothetical protein